MRKPYKNKGISSQERITLSARNRIISAKKEGLSVYKISELEGVSEKSVSNVLKDLGITATWKNGINIKPRKDVLVTIQQEEPPKCYICSRQDLAMAYSKVIDKTICPTCLINMSIKELKGLTGEKFNEVLISLF